jgi:NADH-quinone oxidoreductase subunit N
MSIMYLEFLLIFILLSLFLIDFFSSKKENISLFFILTSFTGLLLSVLLYFEGDIYNGVFISDRFSYLGKILIFLSLFFVGILSHKNISLPDRFLASYYIIIILSSIGMFLMISSNELITIYVGLELSAISLYALSAIEKKEISLEAGIKYLLIGATSSAILLYGISILYGLTNTTYIYKIAEYFKTNHISGIEIFSVILIISGLSFKLSSFPIYIWTPDVYQGSATSVTLFISIASKASAFILFLRIFFNCLNSSIIAINLISIISFLSMTIGNIMAIHQKNMKRFLAYSTISQAGYMILGLLSDYHTASSAVFFYLFSYIFTNTLAFSIVIAIERISGSSEIKDYRGLSQKEPFLALAFTISMLSLAGIPPLSGFFAKFYAFYSAMKNGHFILVILALLNSVIAIYYYLNIIRQIYIEKGDFQYKISLSLPYKFIIISCISFIIIFGILPWAIINFIAI